MQEQSASSVPSAPAGKAARRRFAGRRPPQGARLLAALLCCALPWLAEAQAPGPKQPSPAAQQASLDIPPLRIAVPLLDPGLPKNESSWAKKGVWPELRRAESVHSAHKIKEALLALNRFESAIVSADAKVSADLYLMGEILASNGEDLKIRFRLVDATGAVWIQPSTASWRLPEGWHDNNQQRNAEPFDRVYKAIAAAVERSLERKARQHADRVRRNAQLVAQGKAPKLSELERVAVTRRLVLARFFAPELYGAALRESRSRIQLNYLPELSGAEWSDIESLAARDDAFSLRLSEHYDQFAAKMQSAYALWQRDSAPAAREKRIRQGRAVAQGIIGALAAVATVAAAEKGAGTAAVLAGTAASAALIFSSFRNNAKRKDQVAELNELGRTVQSSLAPQVVELEQTTVTLTGTAQEQFQQWRQLLRELYPNNADDAEAVQIADAGFQPAR